ncbi:unnamed protein product [Prorocentrum cordatum]|uniref:AMP-activated protein kinase glycogen-binding domain-containing protein n=1 Tax=Prorocentrum cordatum TaxID=2364126 RepID=A0ABN9WAN7_9DINO|nr:unnamed protein product [Polarella glacialis]
MAVAAASGTGPGESPGAPGQTGDQSKEYSETMQSKMGSSLVYSHDAGMNYARVAPRLMVGSCVQTPADVDRLRAEGVGLIFSLQEDKDMAHFGLDIEPIRRRAAELGMAHVRRPIRDFDPFHLRQQLPGAVGCLARELASRPAGQVAYVHCTAGLGRAPATALGYMAWIDGTPLDAALAQLLAVRRCHPQVGMIRAATCDIIAGEEGGLCEAEVGIDRPGAATVEVAGLDVGWGSRVQLEKAGGARFVLRRRLPAGSYQYKFIVDGEWMASTDLPTVDDNGNVNNVLNVSPPLGSVDAERRGRLMAAGSHLSKEELELIAGKLLCRADSALPAL